MLNLKIGSDGTKPISLMTPDGRDLFQDLHVCSIAVEVRSNELTVATIEVEIQGCEVELDPKALMIVNKEKDSCGAD